jgi:hypothetical protein
VSHKGLPEKPLIIYGMSILPVIDKKTRPLWARILRYEALFLKIFIFGDFCFAKITLKYVICLSTGRWCFSGKYIAFGEIMVY